MTMKAQKKHSRGRKLRLTPGVDRVVRTKHKGPRSQRMRYDLFVGAERRVGDMRAAFVEAQLEMEAPRVADDELNAEDTVEESS